MQSLPWASLNSPGLGPHNPLQMEPLLLHGTFLQWCQPFVHKILVWHLSIMRMSQRAWALQDLPGPSSSGGSHVPSAQFPYNTCNSPYPHPWFWSLPWSPFCGTFVKCSPTGLSPKATSGSEASTAPRASWTLVSSPKGPSASTSPGVDLGLVGLLFGI